MSWLDSMERILDEQANVSRKELKEFNSQNEPVREFESESESGETLGVFRIGGD